MEGEDGAEERRDMEEEAEEQAQLVGAEQLQPRVEEGDLEPAPAVPHEPQVDPAEQRHGRHEETAQSPRQQQHERPPQRGR